MDIGVCLEILHDEVLERYEGLVSWVVDQSIRKFFFVRGAFDRDDLIQEGRIGLFLAADRFDPDRGRFVDYARVTIRGVVVRAMIVGSTPDSSVIPFEEVVEAPSVDDVRCAVLSLPDLDREVILYTYGLDGRSIMTEEMLAARLGISEDDLARIHVSALFQLKNIWGSG